MDPDDLVQASDLAAFSRGERHSPHGILGAHPAEIGGQHGIVVRAYHPEAARMARVVSGGSHVGMSWFSVGGNVGSSPRSFPAQSLATGAR